MEAVFKDRSLITVLGQTIQRYVWCWLQEGEKSKTEQAVTCLREGDEVTLKACKCKTGSVSLVDLGFRSVFLLTALACSNHVNHSRPVPSGDCDGPASLPHSPPPPNFFLPPTATIAVVFVLTNA